MIIPASSLIICSRNRPKLLFDTVDSVLHGSLLPNELIIIDQSELPNPNLVDAGYINNCHIRYIKSESTGVCRARNEGVRYASNKLLILIDDDMTAPSDWYENMIKALMKYGENTVITGQVLPGIAEQPGGFVPALVEGRDPKLYKGRIWTDVLASCNMAMYSSAFYKVGGFDERLGPGTLFPAADDNDYGYRLLEAGNEIRYSPEARIYHRAWRGKKEYYSNRYAYGLGKGGFYTKHLNRNDSYMLRRMISDILIRFVRFPWRFIHKPRLAIGDLYYAIGILTGSIKWSSKYSTKGE